MNEINDLEQSILKSLAFFNIFKYPLTAMEIWKWLWQPRQKYTLAEVRQALLTSDFLKDKISVSEGFYTLKGSEYFYLLRKQNNNLAERKFRKVIRLATFYRLIPFVRMIAVCNTLAYSNAREGSDIDLFIITKQNKIWLARFFTILFIKFFGLRPEDGDNQDAFCLTFFISENALNLENIIMKGKDIYFPYWIQQLMPIYDPDSLYQKFLKANKWYLDYLPNGYYNQFFKEVRETKWSKIISKIFGFIFSPPFLNRWSDEIYRRLQARIIATNLQELINIDTRVIVNEQMLKFHDNDRREIFYKRWREITHELLNTNKNEGQIV